MMLSIRLCDIVKGTIKDVNHKMLGCDLHSKIGNGKLQLV